MWRAALAAFLAAFVALALAVSVVLAERALSATSNLMIRGEAELLATQIGDHEIASRSDMSADHLEAILAKHAPEGLRYVAVIDGGGHTIATAGERRFAAITHTRPGQLAIDGARARVTGMIHFADEPEPGERDGEDGPHGPPPDDGPPFGPPEHPPRDDGPPEDVVFDGRPPPGHGHGPPPMLVLEIEPPAIASLESDLKRSVGAGVLASLVILGLAAVWLRGVLRISRFEQQAERERRLVSLGRMSAIMAHELRNPLAALKGHAQLLEESLEDDATLRAKAERVVEGAERLEALTKSLLEFVREAPLVLAPVEPATLVRDALREVDEGRVRVDTSEAPATLTLDLARVSRALHNLVDNALQAADGDDAVELAIRGRGDFVDITVRDHGAGLPPGSASQLFEPFATTRTRGTGLGLPIARRIAEQHGGTLRGETHRDGGAVFTMSLPLSPAR
jgi:two-component system sensor histidine kinase HydH